MLTKCLGLAFLHFINSPGHRVHLLQFHRKETKGRREVIAQGDPESGPRAILPGHYRSQPFEDTWQEIWILSGELSSSNLSLDKSGLLLHTTLS